MRYLNFISILFILYFILNGFIELKSQEICTLGSTVFIRQSQLDSFLILHPNCEQADSIWIYGQNISNINALKNLNTINWLSVRNTKINSLIGLDNLTRCYHLVISENKQLKELSKLHNLHFSKFTSIDSNDSLNTFDGLSGDSLMTIIIGDNKMVHDLTGLNSKQCKLLIIFGADLVNFGNHKLINLKELLIEQTSKIDSIRTFPVSKLFLGGTLLFDISEINHLKNLNELELDSNYDLSNCSIDIICRNLDNPNFKLTVKGNLMGCNNKDEIREKCITNIPNESILNQIEIYPQPIANEIYIKGLFESMDYKITNADGKIIQSAQTDGYIDVSNLPKGFYVLQIYLSGNPKKIMTFKVIKIQ